MAEDTREPDRSEDRVVAVEDRFISEWGRMSSSWGINRTMAQIHALLLVTARPHSMDEIVDRLHISRGNASMNLRDLLDWGIIRRTRAPGARKDLYVSDSDIWTVLARVVRERKRREIDPTVTAIRECLAMLPSEGSSDSSEGCRERLAILLEIFAVFDALYSEVFRTDDTFRETLQNIQSGRSEPLKRPV